MLSSIVSKRIPSLLASSAATCKRVTSPLSRTYATGTEGGSSDALLPLSLLCPHKPVFIDRRVSLVTIPGAGGMMGIAKNHVPTIAELKPGLMTIDEPGKQDKYFLSGGFAFVNSDRTCIVNAIEAIPLDQLDPDAAKNGFNHYTQEFAKATDEESRVKAQIGLEVYKSMCFALGINV